jgi:hypothetical protein
MIPEKLLAQGYPNNKINFLTDCYLPSHYSLSSAHSSRTPVLWFLEKSHFAIQSIDYMVCPVQNGAL